VRNVIPARRRIVVGVDGSPASVAALAWAATEARLRRAELDAVYAWENPEQYRAPYAERRGLPSPEQDRAAAAARLATSVRAAFGQAPPPRLRTEVAEGRPERVLPDRAAGAELLVLGSAPRPGSFPDAMGPVHRTCLHRVPCPVVIVGHVTEPVTGQQDLRQSA
jgi:nucleotide-binding universal stress UspA family protein